MRNDAKIWHVCLFILKITFFSLSHAFVLLLTLLYDSFSHYSSLQVCGIVVNWPLQRDTGRMGAACGRVLFALEQLWGRSNETIMVDESPEACTHELPFCLWDAGHINPTDPSKKVDGFGRCASYGKEKEAPRTKELSSTTDQYFNKEKNYFASKEQYFEDEQTVVLGVWNDFCNEHWPELCVKKEMGGEENNTGLRSLYSDLGPPPTEMPSRLQEITKNKKKSLITMR